MNKEELYKKYQEIMLKTNGGVDDYVVALCQISNLLKDYAEEKDQQIRSLEEQSKVIEDFKNNYGYTNYDTHEMLEDLQSRAFQAEDDTKVVEDLLKHFSIYDENEIMNKVKSLEERLKNAITHKFDIGEECWYLEPNGYCNDEIQVFCGNINEISINTWQSDDDKPVLSYKFDTSYHYILEEDIFATREDAEKRLAELKGENK